MIFQYLIIIIFSFNLLLKIHGDVDYCSKGCKVQKLIDDKVVEVEVPHSICLDGCREKSLCKLYRKGVKKFRKGILERHNKLRNELALGHVNSSITWPKASNMRALSWDYELEKIAQCWTNKCTEKVDECKWSSKYTSFNSNSIKYEIKEVPASMVNKWFEKNIFFDNPALIDDYNDFSMKDRNTFAALVWAETEAVGCARSRNTTDKRFYLKCNYGPVQNIEQKSVYLKGEPCSACSNDLPCNPTYKGLCGLSTIPTPPLETYFGVPVFEHIRLLMFTIIIIGGFLYLFAIRTQQ